MHGRPRKAPSQEEQEATTIKATKLRDLQSQVIHFHHNKIYTKEALETSANLLESNPEHYTSWNYRKLAVQYMLEQQSENGPNSESIQSILDEELRVVENALKRNFKSYGAWHHRKWVLSKGQSSTDRELRLLGKFQKLDARNFHAWNYRRFITGLKNIPDEDELQYTTDMICDNFSNYSAWHNRSVILSNLLEKRQKGFSDKESILGEEYEFVRNALFTDPDDQSGWFYHLWLLKQTLKQEPLFLSSWPPHGSKVHLSSDGYLDNQQSLPVLHYQSKARTLPLVVHFSNAVNGVNTSTVTVECDFQAAKDIIWKPLTGNKSGFSRAWLTYLKFPDEMPSSDACPVNVVVSRFPGITSLSGLACKKTCPISFTVTICADNQGRSELPTSHSRISWEEGNFKNSDTKSQGADLFRSLVNLKITKEDKQAIPEWSLDTVSQEIAHCKELLSTTNCKIGKLTLARLLMARNALISYGNPNDGTESNFEDILELCRDLMKMDPGHICYYEDQYSLALLKQLTSNLDTFLKRCGEYREPSSSNMNLYLCVQMNGLSLSQIGSTEHLLWVQMLDLSHNKLRSIEGLEALQLLSCLKLNNNNICSFTALEPLKSLKLLQVLDISHNEIGAHSIDTKRYLCSSPLTHADETNWHFEKFSNEGINLNDHWDAYLLFKDLNLIQLEVMGNAVDDERLSALLSKIMPSLVWLNGEKWH